MSAAKHTPGPWKRRGGMVCTAEVGKHGAPSMIAFVQGKTRNEIFANARVIAVAPELLDAARRVHAFLRANYSDADMPDLLPPLDAALRKAGAL